MVPLIRRTAAAILAACLCVTIVGAAPLEDVPVAEEVEDYRLPIDIKPVNYNVMLRPYLLETDGAKQFTFDGVTKIEIIATKAFDTIVMHSKNINYTTTLSLYWAKDSPNSQKSIIHESHNAVTDKITFKLPETLAANKAYVLSFTYVGSLEDDLVGFYRSSYVDDKNVTKWIGATQFEMNHARRAFPNFDEPKFKATFDLTIRRPSTMNSFGNTALKSTTSTADYVEDVYKTSPKMSSYLLAFVISEFKERSDEKNQFFTISRPEYHDQTVYSHEIGQKLLAEFDKYVGVNYYDLGIEKVHNAAIPDFQAGAMENWGLITYKERALLYHEQFTALTAKQFIIGLIAHEQSHMWFGDLVTCDWWSYTWLNEGFARYFQYYGAAWVEADLELEKQFPVDQIQGVMEFDSTNSTNPMSDENTNTPTDLSRMFNSISYNKGASFMRFMKSVLGDENFKNSLNKYVITHKYDTTVPEDLLTIWKQFWPESTKAHADDIFKSFTEQVGYPVLNVHLAADGASFNISQKRFLLKENDGSDSTLLYTVPITYTTNETKNFESTDPKFCLPATKDNLTVPLDQTSDWIILNIQQIGYYRVNYDIPLWHKIHHALFAKDWSGIHENNRAQLVDDLLNLARASHIDYNLALTVLEYLETETNYLPWTSAFNGYSFLTTRMGTDTKEFGIYIRKLVEKTYNLLGFEQRSNDTTLDIYNREKILAWSCKYGNTECISKAKEYNKNMQSKPVPANIRSAVYCTAVREGTEQDFDNLFNKYKTDTVATEQTLILNALGCVKNAKLVEKYFKIIISPEVRRQDRLNSLSSLYSENNENVSPVFKLVTGNYKQTADALGSYSALATVISNIASRFTEEQQKKDLEAFNAAHKSDFGSSAATLEAAVKSTDYNLVWAKKNLGTVKQYLQTRNGAASVTVNVFTALSLVLFVVLARLMH